MNTRKKAFTLVELIVVITILAVLATVAFISFQGYGQSARDGVRLSDLKSMEKILDLYKLTSNTYPTPVNSTSITFSGSVAWTQGVFGQTAYTTNASMSNVPIDPVTSLEYPYSVTANGQEYQLAAVLENPTTSTISNTTYAGTQEAQVYVKGNYNGTFLKVRKGSTTYLLGVPSILTTDIVSSQLLEDIIANKRLVYNGHKNLPASFSGSIYKTDGGFDFGGAPYVTDDIILFEGDIEDLETNQADRVTFFNKLQTSYSGSVISGESEITELLSIPVTAQSVASNYVATVFNNTLKTKIPIVAVESAGSSEPEASPTVFISQWDVNIDTGFSGFNNLKLPLQSSGTYNFSVDWGDGTSDTITTWDQAEATHNYSSDGIYDVTIDGIIEGFAFNGSYSADNRDDGDKLIDVLQWGNLKLSDGGRQFAHVENLVGWSATDTLDTSNILNMSRMFRSATSFNQQLTFDTSNVTDMSYMFRYASSYNQVLGFNTSSVINMSYMLNGATSYNQPISFDTSSVENMSRFLSSASSFNQTISIDTSSVLSMSGMFTGAAIFNQPLNFNTSSVTSMSGMFQNAYDFNQPINFDTSSVKYMQSMFHSALDFNQPLSFDTSSVERMYNMFYNANKLNQPLNFDTSSVSDMHHMFTGANSFNQPINFNTSSVTSMSGMFQNAYNFNQPLNFLTSTVTVMQNMFTGANSFNQDLTGWCVTNFASEPSGFSTALDPSNKPIWGTCP